MFWFVNIAILIFTYYASSAIAAYRRARQKPPVPGSFENPTIPVGTPIPVLWGTRRIRPIPVWVLPAKLVDVNLDSHTLFGLFPTSQTLARQFKVTGQFVICWGPISGVVNMIFGNNDRSLADQPPTQSDHVDLPGGGITVTSPTLFGTNWIAGGGGGRLGIFLPNIFGGQGRGGGFSAVGGDINNPYGGWLNLYTGNRVPFSPNDFIKKQYPSEHAPSYGELAFLVYEDVNVGESPIPEPADVIATRQPNETGADGWGGTTVNRRTIHGLTFDYQVEDCTPAGMLMDILRSPYFGDGEPSTNFDQGIGVSNGRTGKWEDANRAFMNEGFGLSHVVSGQRVQKKELIDEILRTSDAVLRRHPVTFQRQLKLIRNEATTDDEFNALPLFDEHQIKRMQDVVRNEWKDTKNVVNVSFSDAELFYEKNTVTLKNDANIAMTGGERAVDVDYMMITDHAIALKVAARDLKRQSLRLWKGRAFMTREGYKLDRGDVFRLSFGKYKFNQLLVRVMNVDMGDEVNGEVVVDWVEDIFHYDDSLTTSGTLGSFKPLTIIKPYVQDEKQSIVGTGTARASIHLNDPEQRAYEVAYRAQVGSGALSAWVVVASASPNLALPLFPFGGPATLTDLSGDYNFDAPMSYDGSTYIEYRIRYISELGTVADYTFGFGELHNNFTFQNLSAKPQIQWGVTLDEATGKPTVTFYGLNVPVYTPTVLTGYNLKKFRIWLDDRTTVAEFDIEEGHAVPPALAGPPWVTPALDSEIGGVVPQGMSSIVHIEVVADGGSGDISFFDQDTISRSVAHQASAIISEPTGAVGAVACFLAFPNFACQITGFRVQASSAAQIHLDLWKNNSTTTLPTIADSLGLDFGSAGVDQQIVDGLFGTPIDVAQGDNIILNVLSNNHNSAFTLTLFLIITPVSGDPAF